MRPLGSKNKKVHWRVSEKNPQGEVIDVKEFVTAPEVAKYLNVSTNFVYDSTSKRKRYTRTSKSYVNSRGKTVKKTGRYVDFFKRYSLERIK